MLLLFRVLLGALVIAFWLGFHPPLFCFERVAGDEFLHCYLVQVSCCHFQLMRRSLVVDIISDSRICCLWLDCLLYLVGDVALNPGPIIFPIQFVTTQCALISVPFSLTSVKMGLMLVVPM